jgi:iron complex transport system substrate-binding protein
MWGCVRPSRAIALAAALALAGAAVLAAPPARVVSINLCTDQLAMLLAGPGQLVSVSRLAADPMSSAMPEAAQAYPLNSGHAEEVFLMRPDLVLAGTYSDPAAVAMLRRLGVPVEQVDLTRRLDEVPARLRQVGRALGRDAMAETLVARFEADLARLAPGDEPRPVAALYQANGYTPGADTLADDILGRAGLANLARLLNRTGGGRLALEQLVMADPDLLILSRPYPKTSRAEELLAHPALRALPAARDPAFSGAAWVCGTPKVLRAVTEMAERRQDLSRHD